MGLRNSRISVYIYIIRDIYIYIHLFVDIFLVWPRCFLGKTPPSENVSWFIGGINRRGLVKAGKVSPANHKKLAACNHIKNYRVGRFPNLEM